MGNRYHHTFKQGKSRKQNKRINAFFDYSLLIMIVMVVVFGLVMIYSTSSYKAELNTGDSFYYMRRQGIFAVFGLVAMLIISNLNYRKWKKYAFILINVIIVLLILVWIVGISSHGSARWIPLGPFQFQPSELAKVVIILYMATYVSQNPFRIREWMLLGEIIIFPGIVIILIGLENLSTAIICAMIVITILFVVFKKNKMFFYLGVIFVFLGVISVIIAPYRFDRIKIWLNPEKYEKGYQTMQSLYAIGSGGLFGKGLGQSMQKLGFIPESHNDMIFSVICEELGCFGAICIIILFMLIIYRCIVIAINADDLFGSLLVIGVITHIAVQVIINIAVVTNTLPPTGVPLPFISYGGTALVVLLAEMGIVLSVGRGIHLSKQY